MRDLGLDTRLLWRRCRFVIFGSMGLMLAIALFTPHLWLTQEPISPVLQRLPLAPNAAIAQGFNRQAIARRVHDQLPDLPLENHYIHTETGEVAHDNTLVSRLIQYHYNVQRRPLFSRFDWKLTLADYLGANEWITPEIYPDRWLESNPYDSDLAVIQSLDRQQREALIQALLVAIATR
ncbi:MAG: hypothetical protein F6K30_13100 [Cyanothece sp. SIO2G6]|nr:hypothetical protein [Cyanothece sp. SIO2G6]